jgi:hypothetical protein
MKTHAVVRTKELLDGREVDGIVGTTNGQNAANHLVAKVGKNLDLEDKFTKDGGNVQVGTIPSGQRQTIWTVPLKDIGGTIPE